MEMGILTEDFDKAIEHLKKNLKTIRSGRATPALVEHIQVESYGTRTPLQGLASINTPEPRLLTIEPWDKGIIKDIEKALADANLNLPVANDGNIIRINMPPMTEEDREKYVKVLHQYLEDAKVVVRQVREDAMKKLKNEKESGDIGEDDFFHQQKQVQEMVDTYNEKIKEVGEAKEKEIMTV